MKLKQNGFTLVETVFAMAVLGIAVAAIMQGLMLSTYHTAASRNQSQATQILADKMETLRLCSFSDLTNLPPTFSVGSFQGTTTVEPAPITAGYSGQLKQVTITLRWTTVNTPQVQQWTTYVADNGLQSYIY